MHAASAYDFVGPSRECGRSRVGSTGPCLQYSNGECLIMPDPKEGESGWKDITEQCKPLVKEFLAKATELFGQATTAGIPVRVTDFSEGPRTCFHNGIAYIRISPGVCGGNELPIVSEGNNICIPTTSPAMEDGIARSLLELVEILIPMLEARTASFISKYLTCSLAAGEYVLSLEENPSEWLRRISSPRPATKSA